jgi:hypothetical protein
MARSTLLMAILLALVAAACSRPRSGPAGGNALTLCIENATTGYGNVVARLETTRMEVTPGRSLCREFTPASGSPVITAVTRGGGVTGPLRFSTSLPSGGGACWRWRLEGVQSEGSLLPCREGDVR